jgi:excisionase family DNA binding protein
MRPFRLLTANEVAEMLHVSAAWVYDHADRKRPVIPSVRLGKAVRFRPADVQKFIEDMTRNILHRQLNGASEWYTLNFHTPLISGPSAGTCPDSDTSAAP